MKMRVCTLAAIVIAGWGCLARAEEVPRANRPAVRQGTEAAALSDAETDGVRALEPWWSSGHRAGMENLQENGRSLRNFAEARGTAFNDATGHAFARGYVGLAAVAMGARWLAAPANLMGSRAPTSIVTAGMTAYYYAQGFVDQPAE